MWWGAPQESAQAAKDVPMAAAERAVDLNMTDDVSPAGNKVLAEGIRSLYERRELCDAFLIAGGERFPVHRAMLASMSSNFRGYLKHLTTRPAEGAEAPEDPMKGMLTIAPTAMPPPPQPSADAGAPAPAAPPAATPPAATPPAAPGAEGAAAPPPPAAAEGAAAVAAAAPPPAPPPPPAPASPLEGGRVELQVGSIQSAEAMRIMLDYVYLVGTGAAWEYKPSNAEVNKDILRLARSFDLMHLHEHAARWLARGLTTANVVERLVTCEEFGLGLLREKVIEQLGANPMELAVVSSSPEIMQHPHILQDLLMKVASLATAKAAQATNPEPAPAAAAPAESAPAPAEKAEAKAEEAPAEPEPVAETKPEQKAGNKANTKVDTKAEKIATAAAEKTAPEKPPAKRAKRGAAGA